MPNIEPDDSLRRSFSDPGAPRRIDLHCHSDASNHTAEAALNAINCPECYSAPTEVYGQAKRRGMDFVTITDHDTIEGVLTLVDRADVLVGEELTCWFPEDECKLHLLVFGITPADHTELQSRANDIYAVAEYIEQNRIAHAVAHPIYRQNDKLERWHLERLLLLFKGFESLNGAHSPLHREAFEPVLNSLNAGEIERLSKRHQLSPRWPEPWIKARTAGSDDHGLLNIGRTWTEFPPDTNSVEDVLQCLREGKSQAGGEAGSSAKLAHTFYSVAVRYYTRHVMSPGQTANLPTQLLQTIVGERPAPSKGQLAGMALKYKLRRTVRAITGLPSKLWLRSRKQPLAVTTTPQLGIVGNGSSPADPHIGTEVLKNLFLKSVKERLGDVPALRAAAEKGLPPLGEHDEMFRFVSAINRDVSRGLADAILGSVDDASFTGLFDSIAAVLGQQFVLSPYYFALFHQNKERHLLRQITGRNVTKSEATLKVGLFTDTLDDVNGVARFVRDMADRAYRENRQLIVHTSTETPRFQLPNRKNFEPLLSKPMPLYSELKLNLPPILEVLEWADRQQFDAVHISTPGPMGLCGWLVSKMLRVPMLATYHTDFPSYLHHLTRDHRATNGCIAYMKWLYGQAAMTYSRSKSYLFSLRDMGLSDDRLLTLPPAVDTEKFNPLRRDDRIWQTHHVSEPRRLLYCGRVSVEKNLPLLTEIFKHIHTAEPDVALIIAGDGPYMAQMRERLQGLPAYFVGHQNDAQLGALYAGADLLVFPSRTDTLGQVVMEAQACGLPAVVSNEGGPKEVVADGQTGIVVASSAPQRWATAILELLNDEPSRQRMAHAAAERLSRLTLENTFDTFWAGHLTAVNQPGAVEEVSMTPAGVGTRF